jgi:hypothetical protein
MTKTKAVLPPLTYIDRDKAAWQVQNGLLDGELPVMRISVMEEGDVVGSSVVFHADDADMIIALIEQAKGN